MSSPQRETPFSHRRLVEFADTDMAGIMHFSNYFRFMEVTEHAYFRSLGLSLHWQGEDGIMGGFARIQADCQYRRPLVYLDEVEMKLFVTHIGQRSLSYDVFFFSQLNVHPLAQKNRPESVQDKTCTARGTMTVVPVARAPGEEKMRSIDLPTDVLERVQLSDWESMATYDAMIPKRSSS